MLIVEHDPDVIKEGDYHRYGARFRKNGSEITFEGTYNELLSSNTSTGNALRNKHNLKENIREANHFYNIGPVTQNNLNNVKRLYLNTY